MKGHSIKYIGMKFQIRNLHADGGWVDPETLRIRVSFSMSYGVCMVSETIP